MQGESRVGWENKDGRSKTNNVKAEAGAGMHKNACLFLFDAIAVHFTELL